MRLESKRTCDLGEVGAVGGALLPALGRYHSRLLCTGIRGVEARDAAWGSVQHPVTDRTAPTAKSCQALHVIVPELGEPGLEGTRMAAGHHQSAALG